jgi:hypothetical protein
MLDISGVVIGWQRDIACGIGGVGRRVVAIGRRIEERIGLERRDAVRRRSVQGT